MAVVGWILLVLVGIIVLAVVLPVRVRVTYKQQWCCRVWLCGVIPVYTYTPDDVAAPKKEKRTVKKKTTDSKPSLKQELKALYEQDGVGGVLAFFGQLLRIVKRFVGRVANAVTVRDLRLHIRLGGNDADEVAVNYGSVNAVLHPTLTALSHVVRISRCAVHVEPCFLREDSTADLSLVLWVWPLAVITAGIGVLVRLIAAWVRHMPSTASRGVE